MRQAELLAADELSRDEVGPAMQAAQDELDGIQETIELLNRPLD